MKLFTHGLLFLVLWGGLIQNPNTPPQFEMDQYQFGMLKRGPQWTAESTPETQKLQEGHMANIRRMGSLGKLMAAGPMGDQGDLRGIFIIKSQSIDEAAALAAEDPAIKAGRLKIEFANWMGPKGIGAKFNEAYRKDPQTKVTMTQYYLAFLNKGPQWTAESSPALQKLQNDHLWYIRKMMDAKTYVAAGPLMHQKDPLGICVVAAKTLEEAKGIVEADPAVKAGRLVVEIRPWWVAREVWE